MPKLIRWHWSDNRLFGWAHWCPACNEIHTFAVDTPQTNGAQWSFDGNEALPTFNPSMKITVGPDDDGRHEVCHYFLHSGRLKYCDDCSHDLKGKTVDLPDIPQGYL